MHAEPGEIVGIDTSAVVIVLCAKAEDVAKVFHEIEKTKSRISALDNEGTRANTENLTRLLCQLNTTFLKDFSGGVGSIFCANSLSMPARYAILPCLG